MAHVIKWSRDRWRHPQRCCEAEWSVILATAWFLVHSVLLHVINIHKHLLLLAMSDTMMSMAYSRRMRRCLPLNECVFPAIITGWRRRHDQRTNNRAYCHELQSADIVVTAIHRSRTVEVLRTQTRIRNMPIVYSDIVKERLYIAANKQAKLLTLGQRTLVYL